VITNKLTFDPPTRLPELTQNLIRSSHGHSTPSLKISCNSVQPFSRNVADKETKKERKKSPENNTASLYRGRGNKESGSPPSNRYLAPRPTSPKHVNKQKFVWCNMYNVLIICLNVDWSLDLLKFIMRNVKIKNAFRWTAQFMWWRKNYPHRQTLSFTCIVQLLPVVFVCFHSNIKCQRRTFLCPQGDTDCLFAPLSYSTNFITFPSRIRTPADLFTMRGPLSPYRRLTFELKLINAEDPHTGQERVSLSHFAVRQATIIIGLLRSAL